MNNIPRVGQSAPSFIVQDHNENKVSLEDKQGKWVVLYFYPKDNTPGCTTEAKDFTEYAEEFKKLDAEIIGVSPDSAKSHCKFIDKKPMVLGG